MWLIMEKSAIEAIISQKVAKWIFERCRKIFVKS